MMCPSEKQPDPAGGGSGCPEKQAESRGEGGWSKLADALIEKVVPALATTAGLLGFVALIGGAATWVQLEAAQLPTSEPLSLMSQDRLIPTGAASITGFLLIGAVAMFLVYGLDAGARQARAEAAKTKPGEAGRLTAGATSGVALVVGVELVAATWGLKPDVIWGIAASVVVILATAVTLAWVSDVARPDGGYRYLPLWPATPGEPPPDPSSRQRAPAWVPEKMRRTRRMVGRLRPHISWIALLFAAIATVLIGWPVYDYKLFALAIVPFAIVLGLACLGAARGEKFFWLGLSVFVTAGLLGALITLFRTEATPKLKPIAVLRHEGQPVCAYFIAQTDDRLYLARNTPKKDDAKHAVAGSGYLFSIPDKKVAQTSIGAPINLERARDRMPRMLAALEQDYPALEPKHAPQSQWCTNPEHGESK